MNENIQYVIMIAGIYLLVIATFVSATGIFNRVIFRLGPAIVGGLTIWASAILMVTK